MEMLLEEWKKTEKKVWKKEMAAQYAQKSYSGLTVYVLLSLL